MRISSHRETINSRSISFFAAVLPAIATSLTIRFTSAVSSTKDRFQSRSKLVKCSIKRRISAEFNFERIFSQATLFEIWKDHLCETKGRVTFKIKINWFVPNH
eukprot:NODE_146_length_15710_cov_0.617385.p9 type:complete len:103 gc:universal NODE_146_length_15710_cov_0.617385:8939-9247(+)